MGLSQGWKVVVMMEVSVCRDIRALRGFPGVSERQSWGVVPVPAVAAAKQGMSAPGMQASVPENSKKKPEAGDCESSCVIHQLSNNIAYSPEQMGGICQK
jgi:hypothetical protein